MSKWRSISNQILRKTNLSQNILFTISTKTFSSCNMQNEEFSLSSRKYPGYWNNPDNIHLFLHFLSKQLKLNSIDDWRSITSKDIQAHGGKRLLNKYSLHQLKSMGCPEGKLEFSNAIRKANGFWNDDNIRKFLLKVEKKYNFKTPEDWNSLTKQQIQLCGGGTLSTLYSIFEIKCIGCPEGKSIFSRPNKSPGFWYNKENIENFILQLKTTFDLNSPLDWSLLTKSDVIQIGGRSLLNLFSMYEIKSIGCPEGKFLFNKPLEKRYSGFWNDDENIYNFIEHVRTSFQFNSIEDWNSLSISNIHSVGGSHLLHIYSIFEIKCMGCPEGKLVFLHNANKKPIGYWDNDENISLFLDKLERTFNLASIEDWNRISKNQIISIGGWGLLAKYSKDQIIRLKFPNFSPSSSLTVRSSQRMLFLQVQKLFPQEEIVEDYFHSELSRQSGFAVQFDIFLVKENIAIEYHGKQHYEDIPALAPLEMYKNRDYEKTVLCKKFGIELFVIPYWWDGSIESLKTLFNC